MCSMEVVHHPECVYDGDERMTLCIIVVSCVCALFAAIGTLHRSGTMSHKSHVLKGDNRQNSYSTVSRDE